MRVFKRINRLRTTQRFFGKPFRWFRSSTGTDELVARGTCIVRGRAENYSAYAELQLSGTGIVIDLPIDLVREQRPNDEDYFEIENDGVTEVYNPRGGGHVVNDGADLRVMLIQAIGESNV